MQVVEDQQDQAVEAKQGQIKITVCKSLSGIAEGAEEVYAEFEKQIAEMQANATLGDKNCAIKLSSLKLRMAKSSTLTQSSPAISGNQ